MSWKYNGTNKCYENIHQVLKIYPKQKILLLLVLLMLVLPPPRALAPPSGHDRRDLLPNILQGRIQLLRGHVHHLLTQMLINIGNNATNHVIGIRRASRLVPLPLLYSSFVGLGRSPGRGGKIWGWDILVYHNTQPSLIRHVCSPVGSPQSGSLSVWVRKSTNVCTIWGGGSSTTSVGCLGTLSMYPYFRKTLSGKWRYTLRTPHIIQPEYQKTSSKPCISQCSSYDLQYTSSNWIRSSNERYVTPSPWPLCNFHLAATG